MKKLYTTLFVLAAALFLASCEKEINLDLNESDPQIVIEGWVSDQPGPYEIKITQSTNYFDNEAIPGVSGASVIIRDDMGTADTLSEIQPGLYRTSTLQGQIGHNYSLTVVIGDQTYEASSYLPRIGPIDTSFSIYSPQTGFLDEGYYIVSAANEPAGQGDFYRFRFYQNDSLYDGAFDYFLTDDRFVDGQLATVQFPYTVELGDTCIIEIQSLTNQAYDFYLSLFSELTSAGSPFGAPPANLTGNISNKALGFFGAMSIERDTVIVQ